MIFDTILGHRLHVDGARRSVSRRFPEIPCSYDTGASFFSYFRRAHCSITELSKENVLSPREAVSFFASALIAYLDN